ncbi:haloacid dehalogenase-like hydrolase [Gregarina niphandrodes]|uniref:Haloacid dehalogenase-like hydrolase n=1 Tax=Gregarina niphandrodes TaxID=110365 RepID=A0A023BAW6_GRENI|nr:haloacid dehalogenase-like hydrolase [Gregarina niphandrodes]EZG78822.1 haloacid dehalogenase-like hydrolase [Gregarina niphandrodes]|eukprot:XP_011129189.1 haloacid dehalogenase-like hydrolase [Gregarina niphandrodes]
MASWRIDGKIGVKVVVTDLDSTLWIPGKFVPLANKKCLAALKERNIPVVFATGRSLEAVIRGCRRYGIDPLTSCYPGIFADGAVVLGRNEKEVLKYERMSQEHLERVLQVAVSLDPECIVVQCYLEGQLIYNADPLHYLDSIGGTLEHLDEDVINKVRIRGLYPSMDNPTTDTQMASSDVQDTVLDAVRPPSDVEDAEEDNPKGDAKGDTSPDGLTTTEGDFGVRVDDLGLHRVSAGADLETAAAEEVVFAETSDRPGSLRTGSGKTFTKQYLLTECFSVMLQSKALLDASDEVERQLGRIGLVTLFPEWDTIHIKPKGCDKMEAIKLLAAHLGWDVSRDVVALGDGHNDITMLEGVPHSIAMCSGEEDAVRAGKLVTPISAEQGGWGNILQELML